MNLSLNNILLYLAIGLTILMCTTVVLLKSSGTKCLQNPVQYQVDYFSKASGTAYMCSCNSLGSYSQPIIYQSKAKELK